jgi:hypothetical protein
MYIGSGSDQQLHHLRVTIHGCQDERRLSFLYQQQRNAYVNTFGNSAD